MKIAAVQNDGLTVVRPSGRMDALGLENVAIPLNSAIAARKALAVVDLSDVEFMTSVGLWQFFGAAQAQRRHGGMLAPAAPQPVVQAVLDATAVHKMIAGYPTLEAAIVALRQNATERTRASAAQATDRYASHPRPVTMTEKGTARLPMGLISCVRRGGRDEDETG